MANTTDRLKKLEEQRARINAEIQRVRAREQQQARKDDTRRKILVGSMLLQLVEDGEWPEDKLRARLDTYLVRVDDRALFELPPLDDADRARRDAGMSESASHEHA